MLNYPQHNPCDVIRVNPKYPKSLLQTSEYVKTMSDWITWRTVGFTKQ